MINMTLKLKEISQISIYIKDEAQKVNEVALFQPLSKKNPFNAPLVSSPQRKWNYAENLSFLKRLTIKIQGFLFKHAPFLVPNGRNSPEAKFKTVLAMLLSQETLRDFFLGHSKQREMFYQALAKAANSLGYFFERPEESTSLQIARQLTTIDGKAQSLIEDENELNVQISILNPLERNEILFKVLNEIERPPIESVLEVTHGEMTDKISLITKYAKYKVNENPTYGPFSYTYMENQATSSIKTLTNIKPNALGAMNQRIVFDSFENKIIGGYSGELTSVNHVLEQILLLLDQKSLAGKISENTNTNGPLTEAKILFTSLYSWHEYGSIKDQQESIYHLNQKILETSQGQFKLQLLHFNIPFNALNKYPSPAEMNANIRDLNDEALIHLAFEYFLKNQIASDGLYSIKRRVDESYTLPFLKRKQSLLNEIDQFKELKKNLASQVVSKNSPSALALCALLTDKGPNGKALKGIDKLIYLDIFAREIGYMHSKNCKNSTDRSAGANAADKAQYAFQKFLSYPFLPEYASDEETSLFKVLYSMYLVWEEPEITTALSTGFLGEKFYNNFLQKNPETTKYLIDWLKKHPEIYLGLSDYRS